MSEWVYSSIVRECISCDTSALRAIAVLVVFVLIGGLAAALYFRLLQLPPAIMKLWVIRVMLQVDGGALRVLYNTFQIVQSVSWTIDVPFPYPFSALIDIMSIFSFEFLSMDCLFKESNHFTSVQLWSVTPLMLAAAIFLAFYGRLLWALRPSPAKKSQSPPQDQGEQVVDAAAVRHQISTEHIFLGLLLTYLVVPPVLQVLFQSLDCFELPHSGKRYLRIDTSIRCDEEDYAIALPYIIFFIILYLSIPLVWLRLLWNKRALLNPSDATADEALHRRQNAPELKALRFLFDPYRLSAFLFEPLELYRRVMFVSVLPLVSVSSFNSPIRPR